MVEITLKSKLYAQKTFEIKHIDCIIKIIKKWEKKHIYIKNE